MSASPIVLTVLGAYLDPPPSGPDPARLGRNPKGMGMDIFTFD